MGNFQQMKYILLRAFSAPFKFLQNAGGTCAGTKRETETEFKCHRKESAAGETTTIQGQKPPYMDTILDFP